MSYKDTLELFDELVATGVSESQARLQAQQLGAMGNYIGDVIANMNTRLDKIDKDLVWMRVIGGGMIVACFAVMFK